MEFRRKEENGMKFAAVGFTCIDIYKNLGIQYPTGNGIDLLFNLMEQVEEIDLLWLRL